MIILNEQQEQIKNEAVRWFHFSSEQVFQISGPAGTGKSVLMKAIFDALHLSSTDVYCMSYTGQASIVMRTKGFPTAKSIHSTLYEVVEVEDSSDILAARFGAKGKRKEFTLRSRIDPVRLFFIDEAYMVPDFMVKDILSFGIKVIVAGDPHQLPPVKAEPAFLVSGKIHRLTQLMRQAENSPIVYLANRAMNNEPIHCGMYGKDVLVCNDDEFIPQMVGFVDVILCGTNRTRTIMNNYVRSMAGFAGNIPHYGERIICRKNDWEMQVDGIALANGLSGTVVNSPDPSTFNSYGDFIVNFKPDLTDRVFYNVPVCYKYFVATAEEKNAMKSGPEGKWLTGEFFDFAYALTTHVSQGAEYPNVLYMEEYMRPDIMPQINYTAITRAQRKLIFMKKKNKYFSFPGITELL